MVGSSGGIQAVGPVGSWKGLEKPSPFAMERAMQKYSPPRWSLQLRFCPASNGGKKAKYDGSVTANARLAQAAHVKTTIVITRAEPKGNGRCSAAGLMATSATAGAGGLVTLFSGRRP